MKKLCFLILALLSFNASAQTQALIQNGLVWSVETHSPWPPMNPALQWVDITNMNPQPQAGWTYSNGTFAAPAAPAPQPNPQGFITAVKGIFGGPAAILSLPQTLQNAITLCIQAINEGNWADVQSIIQSQESALNAANPALLPAIEAAVTANNIPVVLP